MLTGVAFCPHPPVLVPAVARGAAPELEDLRDACRTAIRRVASDGSRIVAVGAGPTWAAYEASARGSLAGFGVPLEVGLGSDDGGSVVLPLSLTIGAWLLRDALGPGCGAVGCAIGADDGSLPDILRQSADVALLVLGDGSACRSVKAPGYLDERAAEYDASIAEALRRGAGDMLHPPGYEDGRHEQLLAAGARVWAAVAGEVEVCEWDAELLYDDAPYGVGYFAAAWTRR